MNSNTTTTGIAAETVNTFENDWVTIVVERRKMAGELLFEERVSINGLIVEDWTVLSLNFSYIPKMLALDTQDDPQLGILGEPLDSVWLAYVKGLVHGVYTYLGKGRVAYWHPQTKERIVLHTTKDMVETLEDTVQEHYSYQDTNNTEPMRADYWNPSRDNRTCHSHTYKKNKSRRVKPAHKSW